ncbi:MAG TPA: GNVR domain-containing protein [Geomonas sp.]|nr:GNVR domain-containing protein [Geomonas sp.]
MDNESYELITDGEHRRNDNLRSTLAILFKHKVKILTVFCVVVATATIGSFLRPNLYESKSSILVKIGREYLNRPELGNAGAGIWVSQEEMNNSEIQILTNRDLIKQVIAAIGVDKLYPELVKGAPSKVPPVEVAADLFSANLKVAAVKKSNVIEISFKNRDASIAARAVNTLVEKYTDKHLQVFSGTKPAFMEEQLNAYAEKLRNTEDSLQKFKQQHGVFALDDQRKLLLTQRTDLDSSLKATEDSIAELQKRLGALKGQTRRISESDAGFTPTERDRIVIDARSKLLTLQLEEQELLKKYTESNQLVVNIRKEIKIVNSFLQEQEREISRKVKSANPVYQNVQIELNKAEADYHAQQAKADTLRVQLREVDGALQSLDSREKEIQQLKREQTINEKNYQNYADRAEEARIADDMNRLKLANVSVIEKAAPPISPVSPKRPRIIALGVILGAMAGVGLAFVAEFATQSFSTPESVEGRLGLPVLAAIPYREG